MCFAAGAGAGAGWCCGAGAGACALCVVAFHQPSRGLREKNVKKCKKNKNVKNGTPPPINVSINLQTCPYTWAKQRFLRSKKLRPFLFLPCALIDNTHGVLRGMALCTPCPLRDSCTPNTNGCVASFCSFVSVANRSEYQSCILPIGLKKCDEARGRH